MSAFTVYRMDRWGKARFIGRSYSQPDAESLCQRHSLQAFHTEEITFKKNSDGWAGAIKGVKDFFYQIRPV